MTYTRTRPFVVADILDDDDVLPVGDPPEPE